jgi:hypothetical protein
VDDGRGEAAQRGEGLLRDGKLIFFSRLTEWNRSSEEFNLVPLVRAIFTTAILSYTVFSIRYPCRPCAS